LAPIAFLNARRLITLRYYGLRIHPQIDQFNKTRAWPITRQKTTNSSVSNYEEC
jgi:hypothetical protein